MENLHPTPHDEADESFGVKCHECGAHVGPVGVTKGGYVLCAVALYEVGEVVSLLHHILLIEYALGEPPKPAVGSLLGYLSSWAEDRGTGQKVFSQLHQVMLGASSSVEEQERSILGWVGSGFEIELKTHGIYFVV